MELIKTFGEIRQGDIIKRQLEGAQELVLAVTARGAQMLLELASVHGMRRGYEASSALPIILVYRAWPEGVTEQEMLAEIAARAHDVHVRRRYVVTGARPEWIGSLRRAVARLHEANEAYELGKPPEVEP